MPVDDATGAASAGGGQGCPARLGYDPLDPDVVRDPFPSYVRAQRETPVFYSEERDLWLVTRREDVLAVFGDNVRFSNRNAIAMPLPPESIRDRMPRYPFATGLLFLDDPEHLPARKMVQAPFTPKRLSATEPLIRARAERLLRLEDQDRRLEFVHDFGLPLALGVIGSILGVPEADFPLLQRSVQGAFRIVSGSLSEAEIAALAEDQFVYWNYLNALIDERRAHPKDDFISVLAAYRHDDGSQSTTEQVTISVNTILGAGFETSAQMLAFGIAAILGHRDQWALLRSDRFLLAQAVEECVRWRTVSKRQFRWTTTDVELAGVTIPNGSLVCTESAAANRDDTVFPEPDRFDITRAADNLTFGRGKHFCLGAPLAKLEMRVTVEAFLDLAPEAKVIDDRELVFEQSILIDALHELYLDLGPVPRPK